MHIYYCSILYLIPIKMLYLCSNIVVNENSSTYWSISHREGYIHETFSPLMHSAINCHQPLYIYTYIHGSLPETSPIILCIYIYIYSIHIYIYIIFIHDCAYFPMQTNLWIRNVGDVMCCSVASQGIPLDKRNCYA